MNKREHCEIASVNVVFRPTSSTWSNEAWKRRSWVTASILICCDSRLSTHMVCDSLTYGALRPLHANKNECKNIGLGSCTAKSLLKKRKAENTKTSAIKGNKARWLEQTKDGSAEHKHCRYKDKNQRHVQWRQGCTVLQSHRNGNARNRSIAAQSVNRGAIGQSRRNRSQGTVVG